MIQRESPFSSRKWSLAFNILYLHKISLVEREPRILNMKLEIKMLGQLSISPRGKIIEPYLMHHPQLCKMAFIFTYKIKSSSQLLHYRSSRWTLLGSETMSIIIFSGESSQLPKVFKSTFRLCSVKSCSLFLYEV